MRRLSLVAAVAFAVAWLVEPASAQVAPFSWNGFYVGGNLGYSWGRAGSDYAAVGGAPTDFSSDTVHVDGFVGGAQIGFNYRYAPAWVLGIEADLQASDQHGRDSVQVCGGGIGCDTQTAIDSHTEKLTVFGTVRGRIGYLVTPGTLIYGTGGLAWGHLTRNDVFNVTSALGGPVATVNASASATKVGWTLGGGVESALPWLGPRWTWRAEYLFISLDGLDLPAVTLPQAVVSTNADRFEDHILRFALNYHFPPN